VIPKKVTVVAWRFSFDAYIKLNRCNVKVSTQNHEGAIRNQKRFFRVIPKKNHFWFLKEPFKPGLFKEPTP